MSSCPTRCTCRIFWPDRTEVTVASYRWCVSAGVCTGTSVRLRRAAVRSARGSGGARLVGRRAALLRSSRRSPADRGRMGAGCARRGRAPLPLGPCLQPFPREPRRLSFDELDDGDGFLELAPVGSLVAGRTPTASTTSPATSRSGSLITTIPSIQAAARRTRVGPTWGRSAYCGWQPHPGPALAARRRAGARLADQPPRVARLPLRARRLSRCG